MSDDPKKRLRAAAEDIDVNLGGLFGSLGDAINDMVSRLEDGHSGAVQRDHVFETDKGPVRAKAGIRLRMGGLDAGAGGSGRPKPVNPNRKAEPTVAPTDSAPTTRDLSYDLFEDTDAWIVSADLPGVTRDDLDLRKKDNLLIIETTGERRHKAELDLSGAFDLEGIKVTLQNGILSLRIPKAGEE